jgi:hypothetical protein
VKNESAESRDRRFWRRVDKSGECWVWTGARLVSGYGRVIRDGRGIYIHRLSYEQAVGPIPVGYEIDHLCHERACLRPDHLRAVDHATNMRNLTPGKGHAAKTQCPRGHPYSHANTYVFRGRRSCRTCHNEVNRSYRAHQVSL